MKKNYFLAFLVVLGLVGINQTATAESYSEPDLGMWLGTEVAPVSGGVYFIKNVGSGKFLTRTLSANNGTHACVADYVSPAASGLSDNSYLFTLEHNSEGNYYTLWSEGVNSANLSKDGYLYVTTANNNFWDAWADKAVADGNNNQWDITELPDGTYQLSNLYIRASRDANAFFSPQSNSNYALSYSNSTPGNHQAYRGWKFYDASLYSARTSLYQGLNEAAASLAEEVDAALQLAFESAQGVYEVPTSTVESLNRARIELNKAMKGYNYVLNGGFDKQKISPWKTVGSSTAGGGTFGEQTVYGVEWWNKITTFCQEIRNLPAGVYKLSAQAFREAGSASDALLYAGAYEAELPVKGDLLTAEGATTNFQKALLSFAAGMYPVELEFINPAEGNVEIGIKSKVTASMWVVFDDFRLERLGDLPSVPTQAQLDAIALQLSAADDLMSRIMHSTAKETLGENYTLAEAITMSNTSEEAQIALDNLIAAVSAASASADAYANVNAAIRIANDRKVMYQNYPGYAEFLSAANSAIAVLEDVYEEKEKSDSEITSTLSSFVDMYYGTLEKNIRRTGAGIDYGYVINSDFSLNPINTNGWTSTVNGAWANGVWEFFSTRFDASHTLEGIPSGCYELNVQGFVRVKGNNNASDYKKGVEDVRSYLYAKAGDREYKIPLASLYLEPGSLTNGNGSGNENGLNGYANGTIGANIAFNTKGWYTANSLKGIQVNEGETLVIGVIGEKTDASCWACFDNFQLVAIADEIVLNDDCDFSATGNFDADVSYTRSFATTGVNATTQNGWQTLSLPFEVTSIKIEDMHSQSQIDLTSEANQKFWLFLIDNGTYVETNTIEAHKHYLIAFPNDENYYTEGISLAGDVTFSGTRILATAIPDAVEMSAYHIAVDYKSTNSGYGIVDENGISVFKQGHCNGTFWPHALPKNLGASAIKYNVFGNDDPTSLRQVNFIANASKPEIRNVEGGLEITVADARLIQVYTLGGQLVKSIRVPAGISLIRVPVGHYVIDSQKIIINK